jgi:hypothetical protein
VPGGELQSVVLVAKLSASVDDLVFISESATHRDPMQAVHGLVTIVKRFDGEVAGMAGDGLLARFPTPDDAVDAAAVMVRECEDNGSLLSLGICSGQASEPAVVNHAGLMLKQASAGQIVVCEHTVQALGEIQYPAGVVAVSTRHGGTLAGFVVRPAAAHVAELIEATHGEPEQEATTRTGADSWVVIEHSGARRLVRERDGPVLVGRSPRCHIHIKDNFVSRRHCAISVTGGKAMLEDTSSGGCWIWQPRRDLTRVHGRQVRLPEGGMLFLGHRPSRERHPERVSFLVGSDKHGHLGDGGQSNRLHRQLLRSRSDDRMPLRELEAKMSLPDGATQLPVEVVDLGAGGVGIIADCPLGTVNDVMQLVLDRGRASIRCELRHVGRRRSGRTLEGWLHGAAFLDVDEKVRATVLEHVNRSRSA